MSVKLFIDTETTGLPEKIGNRFPSKYYPPEDFDRYPRIVSLGYVLQDEKMVTEEYRAIIKLGRNVRIDPKAQEKHGLSWQDCNNRGISLQNVLLHLEGVIDQTDLIVAHNIDFDINIILAECYRNGNSKLAEKIRKKEKFCTFSSNDYPSLQKLALRLGIDIKPFNTHDSLDDAKVCRLCYLEIERKGENSESKKTQIVSKPKTDVKIIRKIVKPQLVQKSSNQKLADIETQIENYKKEIGQLREQNEKYKQEIARLKTQLVKIAVNSDVDFESEEEETEESSDDEI